MADELRLSLAIKFTKGTAPNDAVLGRSVSSQTYDVSGTSGIENIVSVGTSNETLALGDIGTIGYCYFHNMDSTNYVEIGITSGTYALKLKAGEFALVRWNSSAVHCRANTSAINLEYVLIPD